ncbi:MAG TPA: VWA domain-containing protein [Dehalococcoidia bacterium]|nr:VWA domain-containing protein [Dehalococcoidia bacterium]
MIGFGAPVLLLGALCAPIIVLILSWGIRRQRAAEAQFAGGGLALLRSGRVSPLWRGVKAGLLLVSVVLAALALARPQIGQTSVVLPREGSDVIVAIDVSRSMEVSDVKPSRLDTAKQAAKSLIAHLGGDRVGLVAFAGSATLRFPLTTDDAAARQVVDGLAIGDS